MNRPTKEELEANLKKTQDELEKLGTNPQPTPSTPEEEEKESSPSQQQPSPSTPQESPSPSHAAPSPSPSKPDEEKETNWKKRYEDSTRQGQKLYEKTKRVTEAITEGNKFSLPTDEEMKNEYPEWDKMDDVQKRLATESLLNKRKNQLIVDALGKVESTHAWNEKISTFIEDPKVLTDYPELEGKEDDFREYAKDKEGVVTDLSYLVPAFLREKEKSKPTKKKGQMFPMGSGGENKKGSQKPGMVSYEESLVLKKTNYKEWKKLLVARKIESPITDIK